jgi:glycosyltransferase involved in cell wall biosynthesis
MWRGKRIGVVVPAFNESRLLPGMLRALPAFIDRIYVVDDSSSDDTWERLRECASPRLVRIRHAVNRGVGAAIVSGYVRGLREQLDAFCVMAGDGQMDPRDLPGLIAGLDLADYVKGNRFRHPLVHRMPIERRLGSATLSWLTRRTTGLRVDDCQCGFTAIRAEALARLPLADLWPRYGYPNDLLALIARAGLTARDVVVTPVYASEASGLHPGHMITIALRIFRRFQNGHPAPLGKKRRVGAAPAVSQR